MRGLGSSIESSSLSLAIPAKPRKISTFGVFLYPHDKFYDKRILWDTSTLCITFCHDFVMTYVSAFIHQIS